MLKCVSSRIATPALYFFRFGVRYKDIPAFVVPGSFSGLRNVHYKIKFVFKETTLIFNAIPCKSEELITLYVLPSSGLVCIPFCLLEDRHLLGNSCPGPFHLGP